MWCCPRCGAEEPGTSGEIALCLHCSTEEAGTVRMFPRDADALVACEVGRCPWGPGFVLVFVQADDQRLFLRDWRGAPLVFDTERDAIAALSMIRNGIGGFGRLELAS